MWAFAFCQDASFADSDSSHVRAGISTTVWVGHLPAGTTKEELVEIVKPFNPSSVDVSSFVSSYETARLLFLFLNIHNIRDMLTVVSPPAYSGKKLCTGGLRHPQGCLRLPAWHGCTRRPPQGPELCVCVCVGVCACACACVSGCFRLYAAFLCNLHCAPRLTLAGVLGQGQSAEGVWHAVSAARWCRVFKCIGCDPGECVRVLFRLSDRH